ncbi:hypothetical protein [Phaeobacter sp. J2-8]|uniref:hypothetical protein n=1 Tax=Phaeobacter sp. J2-8 TaxID=2931394 RepID=UPI001FD2F999|nr:hypothetical protein [Phaeobacter sp. J2-8]MCJ7872110.1 hypothetical protein [Phaeobacter sp. J2-8]
MFDTPIPVTRLHAFASDNAEGLQNAAYLLGGRPWLRRCQRLLQDLAQPGPVTRRMRREAKAQHALLMLEYGHDPESPEAEFFFAVDPTDPCVEEICLLADGLLECLEQESEHV